MDLRVLGPVEVWVDGRVLVATRPQQTAVLAMLAVDANRLVRTETLIDRLWGDRPPDRARRTLHTHISRIRRMLEQPSDPGSEAARLVRRPGGYVLSVDADHVDLHRFRRLVARADAARGSVEERVASLRQAMTLWRGDPLADVPGEWAGRCPGGLATALPRRRGGLGTGGGGDRQSRRGDRPADRPGR